MKKIILLGRYNNSEILTGPEKFAIRLFQFLKKKNCDVTFVDFYFKSQQNSNFLNRLFGYESINKNAFRAGIIRIIIYLLHQKNSVIHVVNLERYQIPIFLLLAFSRLNIITTLHACIKHELSDTACPFNWIQKLKLILLEKLALSKSVRIIFVSKLLKSIYCSYYHIQNKSYEIIYNGIDEIFHKNAEDIKSFKPLKIVFYNSSKYINRGLKNVYNTLVELSDINIEFFIIGEEEKNFISTNNLKIFFMPLMNQFDLINFLRDKHILIKGIAVDTFSLFTAECMTMGKVAIVNNKIGICEFVKNYVNGVIYNNYDEIKIIIKKLYEDMNLLKNISRNAQEIFYILNWGQTFNKYLSLYEKIGER